MHFSNNDVVSKFDDGDYGMKISFPCAIVIVGSVFFLSACVSTQENKEISLVIRDDAESIVMRVDNDSNERAELRNLYNFSIGQKENGLIFFIRDENGDEKKLCAMIDKSRAADGVSITAIEPKGDAERKWGKDMLARRYCLFPGKYRVQVYLIQGNKTIKSNEIMYKNAYRP